MTQLSANKNTSSSNVDNTTNSDNNSPYITTSGVGFYQYDITFPTTNSSPDFVMYAIPTSATTAYVTPQNVPFIKAPNNSNSVQLSPVINPTKQMTYFSAISPKLSKIIQQYDDDKSRYNNSPINLAGPSDSTYKVNYASTSDIADTNLYIADPSFATSTYTPTQYAIPMLQVNGYNLMSWSDYIANTPVINSQNWNTNGSYTVDSKVSPIPQLTNQQWYDIVELYKEAVMKQDMSKLSEVIDYIYMSVTVQSSPGNQLTVSTTTGSRVFNVGSNYESTYVNAIFGNYTRSVPMDINDMNMNQNPIYTQFSCTGCQLWASNPNVSDQYFGINFKYSAQTSGVLNKFISFAADSQSYLTQFPNGKYGIDVRGYCAASQGNIQFANVAIDMSTPTNQYLSFSGSQYEQLFTYVSGLILWSTPNGYGSFDNSALNNYGYLWPNVLPGLFNINSYSNILIDGVGPAVSQELYSSQLSAHLGMGSTNIYFTLFPYNYRPFCLLSGQLIGTANAYTNAAKTDESKVNNINVDNVTIVADVPEFAINASIIQANKISAQLQIPVQGYQIEPLIGKNTNLADETEMEKIADGYYNLCDHIVSAYYNVMLQKEYYWLHVYNQSSTATPLQKIFAVGQKFNYTSDVLDDIILYHPFKVLPDHINTILSTINAGSNLPGGSPIQEDDVISEINDFVDTPVPNSQNVYQLDPQIWNSLSSAFAGFKQSSSESNSTIEAALPNPIGSTFGELSPQTFRVIITKVMAMGALVNHLESYLKLMKLHQISLSNWKLTDSSGNPSLPTLNDVTASPVTDPNTKISYLGTVDKLKGTNWLDETRQRMAEHVSNIEKNLIYPLFDTVMEDIKDDVASLRELTEDRLHGLSFDIYNPEIKFLLSHRIDITHRMIHLFSCCVKTAKDIVTPFLHLAKELDAKVGSLANTLILKPLTSVFESVAKIGLSLLLDSSDLVAPGSEILTWVADANIIRPLPYPLAPFGIYSKSIDNRLFSKLVDSNPNASIIKSIECIVPGKGFGSRTDAVQGDVYYNPKNNTFTIKIDMDVAVANSLANNIKVNGSYDEVNGETTSNTFTATSDTSTHSFMRIDNVTPGVHKVQFPTVHGSVYMWYSATHTLSSDGNSFVQAFNYDGLDYNTLDPKTPVSSGTAFCAFIPDPVVELDERISLTKTFHKWILCALVVPYFVYVKSEDDNYTADIAKLSTLSGFNNYTSHIATWAFAIAEGADAGATTATIAYAIQKAMELGLKSAGESFALSTEYAANMGKIGKTYTASTSNNVFDTYLNNTALINSMLIKQWPVSQPALVNMEVWQDLQDHVHYNPDFVTPGWYPESWERLFGDILLGLSKMAFYTYLQHKVFKKWQAKKAPLVRTKTKLSSMIWNKIKKDKMEHTIESHSGDSKQVLNKEDRLLDNSFMMKKDVEGLHSYMMDNSKSIQQLLKDQSTSQQNATGIKEILSRLGLIRGLN